MIRLPAKFPCRIISWEEAYSLCKSIREQVLASDYHPKAIVGISRGGWFAARCLADLLRIDELVSLNISCYSLAKFSSQAHDTVIAASISCQGPVLVVDDTIDTGRTLTTAVALLQRECVTEIRTGVLEVTRENSIVPDYFGRKWSRWHFLIFPWAFMENMVDMINGVLVKSGVRRFSLDDIYRLLLEFHSIERTQFENFQSLTLLDVLEQMSREGIVFRIGRRSWEISPSGVNRYNEICEYY